ncbi:thioredoxin family protein [Nitratifractor sp.]
MKNLPILLLFWTVWLWGGPMVKSSQEIPYSGKPLMLLFDSQTCPYCKKMKKELREDPRLHKVATGFDIYRIPRDDQKSYTILGNPTTTQNLQMLYKVKVTPYVVLLTSKGVKIWQIPGYVKPEVLAAIMEFVKGVDEGKYRKSQWREYLRKAGVI